MHMHGFLIWKVVHVYLGVAHHQSDNSCVFCVPLKVFLRTSIVKSQVLQLIVSMRCVIKYAQWNSSGMEWILKMAQRQVHLQ